MLVEYRMASRPDSPLLLRAPARKQAGVVLTSPHSGRLYPADFLAASRLDALAIRRSEDSFVDELLGGAVGLGLPLLAANFPRAYCDVNREAWELDPGMFIEKLPDYVNTASPRVQAGLGTLARIVGNGEPIYAHKLPFAEAERRITQCWQPFHAALQALICAARTEFGACLVIDCHSMPSLAGRHGPKPDVILGDGHGTSCDAEWTDFFQTQLAALGFSVRRNDPYAGGYITRHYGRPREQVQVIQLEISRGLYMNEKNFTQSPQFAATAERLTAFLAAVVEAARNFAGREAYRPAAE